ncbi:hypothetical protein AGMMS50239_00190 [Bacteroidia bacterium]|nr:hypothetical protein AGMMS50239_00190 [Bacteroidia bacterium]
MINIVIAFDNQNVELGSYFDDCKKDIVEFFNEQNGLVQSCCEIPSPQCNVAYIDVRIPQLNSNPFIFIAYTHGIEDGLRCSGDSFVSTANSHHFTNSLFYSTACLAGRKLAPDLINKGCKAFIGYMEESEVFKNAIYKQTFIECDNYALKMLLIVPEATVETSFVAMKNHFTNKIDRLQEMGESPLFTASLVANREALICLGDKNLKKEDLFVPQ